VQDKLRSFLKLLKTLILDLDRHVNDGNVKYG
jgi:hypothetical protein